MSSVIADAFQDAASWQVFASGQARGNIETISGPAGQPALRLHYDFHGGSGFIALRYPLAFAMPNTFRLRVNYRGEGPPNHLECKVASPGGANVWRHQLMAVAWPQEWQPWTFTERELAFAWGPAGGGAPAAVEALEFVIVAGPGGRGHVDLCELAIIDETLEQAPVMSASSAQAGFEPSRGEWRACRDDHQPWWCLDFGRMHRYGGLVIDWPEGLPVRAFSLESSAKGNVWHTLYQATYASGARTHIATPGAESRYLRLCFHDARHAALRAVHVQPDAFSQSTHAFMHAVARDYPRGWHPRYWHREQSYWTPVGLPEGGKRALINEEGMVEIDEGGFSLEPYLWTPDGLLTWAEMSPVVGLFAASLPMPQVTLTHELASCEITPWIDDAGGRRILRVRYRWTMKTALPQAIVAIAVRPYQVTPPWQAFRNLGGMSPIAEVDPCGQMLRVEHHALYAHPAPDEQGAALMEQGGVLAYLSHGKCPPRETIADPSKLASAAMIWHVPQHAASWEVTVAVPYDEPDVTPAPGDITTIQRRWEAALNSVTCKVPSSAQVAFDCWKTCAGHILLHREGAGFQPGPRRYTRSWIRDSVIMGSALAKTGMAHPLRNFLSWYAAFQRDDGFVPCVVDRDGVDWIVEHDSHGQFLWGIREAYRYEKNESFLATMLPHAIKAAEYLVSLRRQRTTDFYQCEEQRERYGLLPESASHEGYLAHHVHSYWDDFWGIRGLEACADICCWRGLSTEAQHWRDEAASFHRDTLRSMQRVIEQKHLDYLPGSVEWADFDPTATANAIAQLDFVDALPPGPLRQMFITYLTGMRRKQSGEMPWLNYSAYEIRIIGALVRLGQREQAYQLLQCFLADRRPVAWNQWPEITWRDPRAPGHLGDVPHSWIGAEFILALTGMIAWERESIDQLVLAAGVPWSWVAEEEGLDLQHWPTRYGRLHLLLRASEPKVLWIEVGAGLKIPPGGIVMQAPCPEGMGLAVIEVIEGHGVIAPDHASVFIRQLPLRARLIYRPHGNAIAGQST